MTPATLPFKKVLIANRGEIACRVIETARKLGIATVAVHHAFEADARHVRMADEAYELPGDTPVAAHLDADAIVATAQRAGADCIHPGYGFLSENAGFARKVSEAGLTFIGPDAEVIRLMGDKIVARDFAAEHGVPVAPSVMPTGDLDGFVAEAAAIGFPLLIKAAAGGGGKGMSIVRNAEELESRARLASSEALRYFADGRVYAERYIERPRHIEVQVLGDGEGGAIHLFERECSIQRRFQKIVEEAPAANLAPALRDAICDAAVRLAAAARYRNAGTVEFILGQDGVFYFLEMNTRLQVEHPVTEMITGLDLVECQFRIAAGLGLPLAQAEVRATGHSIECRLCAEDPANDFLPETGRVLQLRPPAGPDVRFENGLVEGQEVTTSFDPMLAKLVVHGADRDEAIRRMRTALSDLVLLGIRTNGPYLRRILGTPAFGKGDLHTGFVTEHADELAIPETSAGARADDHAVIVAALSLLPFQQLVFEVPEPYATMAHWRN